MKLTVDTLRSCYDFLATCEPFSSWNLPSGEDVEFQVLRSKDIYGDHYKRKHIHRIRISAVNVQSMNALIKTMAHEMVHLALVHARCHGRHEHGKAFKKLAAKVCRKLWLDPSEF